MFVPLPHISLIRKILKFLNNIIKILKTDFIYVKPCLFNFLWPSNGIETRRYNETLSWSSQIIFWFWRCNLHLVHITKLQIYVQGDVILTILYIPVCPRIDMTTIFHVRLCGLKPVGEKGGPRARARTHTRAHTRNLPSPEAFSPDIEEGAVNWRPLQVLFLLGEAHGPLPTRAPSRYNLRNTLEGWSFPEFEGRWPSPSDAQSPVSWQQNEDKTITSDIPISFLQVKTHAAAPTGGTFGLRKTPGVK